MNQRVRDVLQNDDVGEFCRVQFTMDNTSTMNRT